MAKGKKRRRGKGRDAKPEGEKIKLKFKSNVDSRLKALSRFIDHPLVADLLAVGAIAAVAAIVEHGARSKSGAKATDGSRQAVKTAGEAAAAAIGQRLLKEAGRRRAKGSGKEA